jgi:hypothetical protein
VVASAQIGLISQLHAEQTPMLEDVDEKQATAGGSMLGA